MADVNQPGDVPPWPAAESTSRGDEPTHLSHRGRGVAAATAYAIASAAYIVAFMTPMTSWEHHPFAGPLVAIYESRQFAEFAVSFGIWFGLGLGMCWPAFRP